MPRSSGFDVRVDGVWLRSLGHVGEVRWSTRFGDGPCGPDLATVELDLDLADDTGFVRLGRTLEVFDRGFKRWGGRISGVSRGVPRSIEAKGWPRVHWDASASLAPGYRIGYTADDVSYTPTAATSPRWLLDASDLDIGVADDRLFTRVVATYVSSHPVGGDPVTSTVQVDDTVAQGYYGVLPFELDLTPLDVLTAPEATAYAQSQLLEFAIPEWTSRVITNSQRLLTIQGNPAHLPEVQAGQMVRMFHMPTTYGGTRKPAGTDVILGEVEFSTASPNEVTIAPQRVAARSIADAVREIAEARRAAEQMA